MKKILLLINPHARSGSGAYQEVCDTLEAAGHKVIDIPEHQKNDFKQLIYANKEKVDLIIVGGGDGSINHILPALVDCQLPLLVYPLGTANILARSFNLKADVKELLSLVEEGIEVKVDLGMVNGIYFINVCGLGVSTEINRTVSKTLKKMTGPFSFWLTGIKLLRNLRPYKMKLYIDEKEPIVTRTWQITICNGRNYGAWMTIEPNASYDDGILHCLSTEVTKTWEGLKLLPSYLKGTYKEHHEVSLLSAKKLRIETKYPMQIDVDGDVKTNTPASFEVKPKILKIVVPRRALANSSPIS